MNERGHAEGDAAPPPSELMGKVKLFFQRAFRTDLDPVALLPDEHVPIEVERVAGDSRPFERVLLWRRAALFVALCFQIPPTFISMIKTFIDIGKADGGGLTGIAVLPLLANIGLIVAMAVAHKRWDRWASSKKLLYWAWVIAFLGPFLLWLIPLRAVQGGGNGALVGFIAGFFVIIDLGPKALALVPGIMRAAIVAKTVLPGATTPGWIMLLAAPFYLLLLYVLLLTPYQLAGGSFMAPAIILLTAAPIFMWRAGRQLVRPLLLEEVVASVRALRTTTLITNLLGGLFLMIALIDMFGEYKFFGPADAILPLFHMVANVFLLSIVGLDLMLTQLGKTHLAEKTAAYRDARKGYEAEMANLVAAALIEPEPEPEPLGDEAPAAAPPGPKLAAAPAPKLAAAPAPKLAAGPAPKPAAAVPPRPAALATPPKPVAPAPLRPPPPRAAEPQGDRDDPTPGFDPDDPNSQTQRGGPRR